MQYLSYKHLEILLDRTLLFSPGTNWTFFKFVRQIPISKQMQNEGSKVTKIVIVRFSRNLFVKDTINIVLSRKWRWQYSAFTPHEKFTEKNSKNSVICEFVNSALCIYSSFYDYFDNISVTQQTLKLYQIFFGRLKF